MKKSNARSWWQLHANTSSSERISNYDRVRDDDSHNSKLLSFLWLQTNYLDMLSLDGSSSRTDHWVRCQCCCMQ